MRSTLRRSGTGANLFESDLISVLAWQVSFYTTIGGVVLLKDFKK